MTTGAFAGNSEKEEKNETAISKKEISTVGCCTATLTYNGFYVDHVESCNPMLSTQGNCASASETLLDRNPEAKKALAVKQI